VQARRTFPPFHARNATTSDKYQITEIKVTQAAEPSSDVFRKLYDEWIVALQQRNYQWFEDHAAEDFSFSAHPFPGLTLNKTQFLENEKNIKTLRVEPLKVDAHTIGNITLTFWVARIDEETLSESIKVPGFPSPQELADLVRGKTMVYVDAWRYEDGMWRFFHHHVHGPAD
jgi:hypothetical protein